MSNQIRHVYPLYSFSHVQMNLQNGRNQKEKEKDALSHDNANEICSSHMSWLKCKLTMMILHKQWKGEPLLEKVALLYVCTQQNRMLPFLKHLHCGCQPNFFNFQLSKDRNQKPPTDSQKDSFMHFLNRSYNEHVSF